MARRVWGAHFALVLVSGCAMAMAIATAAYLDEPYTGDELAYFQIASNFADRGSIETDSGLKAFFSPGYAVLLGLFYKVFGTSSIVAGALNTLLGGLSVTLVYFCTQSVTKNHWVALASAGVYSVYLPRLVYTEYLFKENLSTPLLLFLVLLTLRFFDPNNRQIRTALLAGIVFSALIFTSPSALGLSVVCLVVMVLAPGSLFKGAKNAAAFSVAAALTIMPWLMYNHTRLGVATLSTNPGFNLYIGNNPNATGWFISVADTPMGDRFNEVIRRDGELAATQMMRDAAVDYITNNPTRFIELTALRLSYFWIPPLHQDERNNRSAVETAVRWAWAIQFIVLCTFSLLPLVFAKARSLLLFTVYGFILAFWGLHGFVYMIIRYREPIMPLLAALATYGVWLTYKFIKERTADR